MSGPQGLEHGDGTGPRLSLEETRILGLDTSAKTAGSMPKARNYYKIREYHLRPKTIIIHKLKDLEDRYLYLVKNSKTPLSADELKLKAEALRWVLSKQDSL